MKDKKVNILGSKWVIKRQTEDKNRLLFDCSGYCDWSVREIIIKHRDYGTIKDLEKYTRKVLRHEIVHAFLFESGLAACSGEVESWADNEAMVDWIAIQGQKIYTAWQEADALD